jgi:predicted PhzF superfamily epimerase YddE/YHI9
LAQIAQALGLKAPQILAAQLLDNGPVWLGLLLESVQTVLALEPDHLALKNLGIKVGVVAVEAGTPAPALIARSNREARAFNTSSAAPPSTIEDQPTVEVRAFAAPVGVMEDPVTGSLNASLAQWLMADGYAPTTYTASQGTCLDRAGRVHLVRDASGQVWVGGDVVTCITGTVRL